MLLYWHFGTKCLNKWARMGELVKLFLLHPKNQESLSSSSYILIIIYIFSNMFLDLCGKYRISVISFSTNLVYLLPRLLPNIVLEMCCCVRLFQRTPGSPSSPSSKISIKDEADQVWPASYKNPSSSLSRSTNLHRAGSIQNLISKFSGPDQVFSSGCSHLPKPGRLTKAFSVEVLDSPTSPLTPCSPEVPDITVTPPAKGTSQSESAQDKSKTSQVAAGIDCPEGGDTEKADLKERKSKTQIFDFGRDSVADSGLGSVSKKEKPLTWCFDVIAWDKTLHHQHGTAGFWNDRFAWNKIPITGFYGTCSSIIPIRLQIHSLVKIYSLLIVLMQITHAMLHQSDSAANKVPTHCPRQDRLVFKSYLNESAYLHVEVQLSLLDLLTTCFFISPIEFFCTLLKMQCLMLGWYAVNLHQISS